MPRAARTSERVHFSNLPTQLTSFIGRERELVEVKRLLAGTRLLTLMGSAGCGKTRLALRVAEELLDEFSDGVWLAELAPLSDESLVLPIVASSLGVREQPGQPLLTTATNFIREKNLLLVIDNCEHLRHACAQLAEKLLLAAPHLKILATSRETLGATGEITWLVPSLSIPEQESTSPRNKQDLSRLMQYDALRLFVERAASVLPTFTVTDQNAMAVLQVCSRLDGMPLAIELAAARANVLAVGQIAARLDDRFALLTANNRSAVLPRHQTLRAAIDWSYDLLSEKESILFRRLAVFARGFTLDAAEAICAGDGIAREQVLNLLSQLVTQSLVVAQTLERREARYYLLETIREYAREKLRDSDHGERLYSLHLDFFLKFAEDAEPNFQGAEAPSWFDRVESEWDNLRFAIQWSLENNRGEKGLRIASALLFFAYFRGYLRESHQMLLALLKSQDAGQRNAAFGKGLFAAGAIGTALGNLKDSRALYDQSIAILREAGEEGKGLLETALTHYSFALAWSEPRAAARHAEEAVRLNRESGNRGGLAEALDNLVPYQ